MDGLHDMGSLWYALVAVADGYLDRIFEHIGELCPGFAVLFLPAYFIGRLSIASAIFMTIIGGLLLIPLVRGLRRRGRARKPIKSMLQRIGFIAGLAVGVTSAWGSLALREVPPPVTAGQRLASFVEWQQQTLSFMKKLNQDFVDAGEALIAASSGLASLYTVSVITRWSYDAHNDGLRKFDEAAPPPPSILSSKHREILTDGRAALRTLLSNRRDALRIVLDYLNVPVSELAVAFRNKLKDETAHIERLEDSITTVRAELEAAVRASAPAH